MNRYLGTGGALLVAWGALRLGFGATADGVSVVGIVGLVLVVLGVRHGARRTVAWMDARSPRTPADRVHPLRPTGRTGRTVDLNARRRRRHG